MQVGKIPKPPVIFVRESSLSVHNQGMKLLMRQPLDCDFNKLASIAFNRYFNDFLGINRVYQAAELFCISKAVARSDSSAW